VKNYCITHGTGEGNSSLTSFDNALLSSGIANYNLVKISSILPADSKECTKVSLKEGSILHTAYADITSSKVGETISAAIGVAIPKDNDKIGVIMEYAGYCAKQEAIIKIESMLQEAMQNRGYSIKEIKTISSETIVPSNKFATAFAALSIW